MEFCIEPPVPYESLSEHTSDISDTEEDMIIEQKIVEEIVEKVIIKQEAIEYIIIEDDIIIKQEIKCYGCDISTSQSYLYDCIRLCTSCYEQRNIRYNCGLCNKFMLVGVSYEGMDRLICTRCCLDKRKEYYANIRLEKYDYEDYKDEDYSPQRTKENPTYKDKNRRKKKTYKCIKCDTIKCSISRYGSKSEPVCPNCYKREFTVKACSQCHYRKKGKTWFNSDKGQICKNCYLKNGSTK